MVEPLDRCAVVSEQIPAVMPAQAGIRVIDGFGFCACAGEVDR